MKEGQIQMGAVGPHVMYDSNSKSGKALFAAVSEAHKANVAQKKQLYTSIDHPSMQSPRIVYLKVPDTIF